MSATGMPNRQRGVTLAEMVIALAIGAIVIAGSLIFLHRMVSIADENRDGTFASLQVQFVGFWINEDVVQAQEITFGNESGQPDGFPLTIRWTTGNGLANETITCYFKSEEDARLGKLFRSRAVCVRAEPEDDCQDNPGLPETHVVAEHLVIQAEEGQPITKSGREEHDSSWSVRVEVAADVDGSTAESTYEIFPRVAIAWGPKE